MQEHCARRLCLVAATEVAPVCMHCRGGPCTMWHSFMREAAAAIEAVRAFAQLTMRRRPRLSD